jgi:plastocyanin
MKNVLIAFILMNFTIQLNSQIIINEIMYNPPESGADFLEYIEFYNNSPSAINILDYSIEDAVLMTFPDTTIPAYGYFLIAVDSFKLDSVLSAKAFKWQGGALRNSDEIITLLDNNKNIVDSVHYYVAWSGEANGNGSSLELCKANVDNSQAIYWRPSDKNTGIHVNGKLVKATPGYANSVNCGDHTVLVSNFKFSPDNLEIYTGEQVEWINQQGEHNVNGSKNLYPDNPESFGNGSPSSANWTFVYKFNTPGVYNYRCDLHANQGMIGTITVRNKDINYPVLSIKTATSTDQQGLLDSVNKQCTLEGFVYGVNIRPGGLQFTLIDPLNYGIGVFKSNGNLGYSVEEGDHIVVKGILNQFNGLAQIIPDSIILVSTNNPLIDPKTVTDLNETTESSLISIKNVEIQDPLTWTNSPLGFTVKITDGIQEYDLRIDNDVNIHGTQAPTGKFNITGIGSQFDISVPFLDGYQIMPRYLEDIELITKSSNFDKLSVKIYPNPVHDILQIDSEVAFERMIITNQHGKRIINSQFSNNINLNLEPGLYFLQLMGSSETVLKFIKL